jgi:hypothetical protein
MKMSTPTPASMTQSPALAPFSQVEAPTINNSNATEPTMGQ